MADQDRDLENIGDEENEQDAAKRQQSASGSNAQNEPTDTLEDRNLSGASTWATLPDQNQTERDESEESDSDSTNR